MNNISDGSIVSPIVLNIRGLTPVRAYKSVVRQLREIRDRMKMQPKYDIEEIKDYEAALSFLYTPEGKETFLNSLRKDPIKPQINVFREQ